MNNKNKKSETRDCEKVIKYIDWNVREGIKEMKT
jgi:hypothetical protein